MSDSMEIMPMDESFGSKLLSRFTDNDSSEPAPTKERKPSKKSKSSKDPKSSRNYKSSKDHKPFKEHKSHREHKSSKNHEPSEEHKSSKKSNKNSKQPLLPQISLEERISQGSSLFDTQDNRHLFELKSFRAVLAGFPQENNYAMKGDAVQESLKAMQKSEKDEVRYEYESLWVDLQIFWDTMLRQMPNRVVDDKFKLLEAVDLLADVSIGRLIAKTRSKPAASVQKTQLRELKRRLQRLQLMLLEDVVRDNKSAPKLNCGCSVNIKRVAKKSELWSPLFPSPSNEESNSTRANDRSLSIRDLVSFLRLEDYLIFVSLQIQASTNGSSSEKSPPPADDQTVAMAQTFMHGNLRCFLDGYANDLPKLKELWIRMLCKKKFRTALKDEVRKIVEETKSGKHRDWCVAGNQGKSSSNKSSSKKSSFKEPSSKEPSSKKSSSKESSSKKLSPKKLPH